MEHFPVYPYAFIQVAAVARQWGIEVICRDLLGVAQSRWEDTLQDLIAQHAPELILITLRNTDSLNAQDYEANEEKESPHTRPSAYFPIENTKHLIYVLRRITHLKIAVGGFGFSVMPEEIMRYLRPDLGLAGDPDAFFEHFEQIKLEKYGDIANLLYFQDGRLVSNPRALFPPLGKGEYTPQVIKQMMAFYEVFPSPGFQGAPIEIIRGCNHACVFCSEPLVKGSQVRYRAMAAIMADIEMLVSHGITQLYMVSSELNPEGDHFMLELAENIRAFNLQQPEDQQVTWFGANYLLTFGTQVHEQLSSSGFTGGWFDITALDDENARAMQTPYRNRVLLTHLKEYAQFKRIQYDLKQTKAQAVAGSGNSEPQDLPASEALSAQEDLTVKWTLFMGNPATTPQTIAETIRVANQAGLAELFTDCGLARTIRVFDYEKPAQATLDVTYSVMPDLEHTGYQQLLPSFAYSPALLKAFGSGEAIDQLFKYISETYLSTKYQQSRDWLSFISQNTTPSKLAEWLEAMPDADEVQLPEFFGLDQNSTLSQTLEKMFSSGLGKDMREMAQKFAKQLVDFLVSGSLESFADLYADLGFPSTAGKLAHITPYDLAVMIYTQWSTEQQIIHHLSEKNSKILSASQQDFAGFCLKAILYKFNLMITPKYRELFVQGDKPYS